MARVFGVIRVSRTGDESAVSPKEQRQRLVESCERDGATLVEIGEELDVSGGSPLRKRPALRRAVDLVESGDVDEIRVVYFDRLVRSLNVQAEILSRVEAAGGRVMALDFGQVSNETASKWLSATMVGMVAEYHRRATAERTEGSKAAAVARGVPPFPSIPLGLRKIDQPGRADHGKLEPDPMTRDAVVSAFTMRANGSTVREVRAYLREQGHELSYFAVQKMLASRLYLGELRFGRYTNLSAVEPIVDASLWRRVQATRVSRGRRAKSERLLARQGILRCASCGSALTLATLRTSKGERYPTYRCVRQDDCPRRVAISAVNVERLIEDRTTELLSALHGSASVESDLEAARSRVESAQAALDAAVDAFDGLNATSVKAKLARLQVEVDDATAEHEELRRTIAPMLRVSVPTNRDDLTLDEWRDLIRLAIETALVAPGRGPIEQRVTITPRSREALVQ